MDLAREGARGEEGRNLGGTQGLNRSLTTARCDLRDAREDDKCSNPQKLIELNSHDDRDRREWEHHPNQGIAWSSAIQCQWWGRERDIDGDGMRGFNKSCNIVVGKQVVRTDLVNVQSCGHRVL